MTNIIKRWEKVLYYLILILFVVLFSYITVWARGNEQIIKLDKVTLENIAGYIFIILLYVLQWGKQKVAQSRILKLSNEWQVIDAFSSKKNKRIILIFLALNVLVLIGINTRYSHFIILLFAIMNRYFESMLNKGYLDSKRFIVKHKMYALDGIIAIKDEFGTNFTIYYETESYQIFTGSDLIKDEILNVLKDKRRIPL
ncbi:hypothetical protein [Fusibacter bizertensis]